MDPNQLPPPAQLMKFIVGKWISKPIYVVAEFCIADMLSEGPKSIEELAKESRTHAPSLYRMMRALASVGIFFETHPQPDASPSDGPNMIPLDDVPRVLDHLLSIRQTVEGWP